MKKEVMEKGVRWLYASRAVMGILGSVLVLELLSGLGVTGVCVMIGEKAEEALPYGYLIVYVFWMLYFTLVSYVLQEKRSDLIKKDLVEVVSGLCVAGGLFFVGESYGREWMRETFELRWSTLTCMMLLLYFALATALNAWAFYRCKSRTIKSEGRKGEKMLHAAAFVSMAVFVPSTVVTGWFITQLVPFLGGSVQEWERATPEDQLLLWVWEHVFEIVGAGLLILCAVWHTKMQRRVMAFISVALPLIYMGLLGWISCHLVSFGGNTQEWGGEALIDHVLFYVWNQVFMITGAGLLILCAAWRACEVAFTGTYRQMPATWREAWRSWVKFTSCLLLLMAFTVSINWAQILNYFNGLGLYLASVGWALAFIVIVGTVIAVCSWVSHLRLQAQDTTRGQKDVMQTGKRDLFLTTIILVVETAFVVCCALNRDTNDPFMSALFLRSTYHKYLLALASMIAWVWTIPGATCWDDDGSQELGFFKRLCGSKRCWLAIQTVTLCGLMCVINPPGRPTEFMALLIIIMTLLAGHTLLYVISSFFVGKADFQNKRIKSRIRREMSTSRKKEKIR